MLANSPVLTRVLRDRLGPGIRAKKSRSSEDCYSDAELVSSGLGRRPIITSFLEADTGS